eukprot:TRINITY_DN3241_c0_g2_i1.p1 TRINITY_DN3241_c0_g2~~TRINITY_DN3241_c0_g2_i1.p1  ORF type:complete len:875 (-),score=196.93 TRINITY_DN3241_c0_g2_i1:117-2690(-)
MSISTQEPTSKLNVIAESKPKSKHRAKLDQIKPKQATINFQPKEDKKSVDLKYHSGLDSSMDNRRDKTASDIIFNVKDARSFDKLLDSYAVHEFLIKKGVVYENTPEFQSFKRCYFNQWTDVNDIIKLLEDFGLRYSIPILLIDGSKLIELLVPLFQNVVELEENELHKVIINFSEISVYLNSTDRVLASKFGDNEATRIVQDGCKGFLARRLYDKLHMEKFFTTLIQRNCKMFIIRSELLLVREQTYNKEMLKFRKLFDTLETYWNQLRLEKHVFIHIPSIWSHQSWRDLLNDYYMKLASQQYILNEKYGVEHWHLLENFNISRGFALRNSNANSIYISPIDPSQNTIEHYHRILSNNGLEEIVNKSQIVTNDFTKVIKNTIPASATALFSFSVLNKIRRLKGVLKSVVIPSEPSIYDWKIANELNSQIIAPLPMCLEKYGSKSGQRRLLDLIGIGIPYGTHDIMSSDEILSQLAVCITRYPNVTQWLIKTNYSFDSQGLVLFSLSILSDSMLDMLIELNDLDEDYLEDARFELATLIVKELQKKKDFGLVLICPEIFDYKIDKYFQLFDKQGGIIEAIPDNISGSPWIQLFLPPGGGCEIVCSFDQVLECFVRKGSIAPQRTLSATMLEELCKHMGYGLYKQGIRGYVTFDLVLFELNGLLKIWCVDLDFKLHKTATQFQFVDTLLQGTWQDDTYVLGKNSLSNVAKRQISQNLKDIGGNDSLLYNRTMYFSEILFLPQFSVCDLKKFFKYVETKADLYFSSRCLTGPLILPSSSLLKHPQFHTVIIDISRENLKSSVQSFVDEMNTFFSKVTKIDEAQFIKHHQTCSLEEFKDNYVKYLEMFGVSPLTNDGDYF